MRCSGARCGLRRTSANAIMTAWQCGGQGFESPQLHPDDQAVSLRGSGLSRLWLQFAHPCLAAAGRSSDRIDPQLRGDLADAAPAVEHQLRGTLPELLGGTYSVGPP